MAICQGLLLWLKFKCTFDILRSAYPASRYLQCWGCTSFVQRWHITVQPPPCLVRSFVNLINLHSCCISQATTCTPIWNWALFFSLLHSTWQLNHLACTRGRKSFNSRSS
jgi:hypothetical protein